MVLSVAFVTAGCAGTHDQGPAEAGGAAARSGSAVAVPDAIREFRSSTTVPSVPHPVRLLIPALGVDSSLERLGRTVDGVIEVPVRWQRAGWYQDGPWPGEPGAAVVLGHLDSPRGPAVFAGLAGLTSGARVTVSRADGSTLTFRVLRVEERLRSRFPVTEVFWPTLRRELRLITCGGSYVRAAGGYQSNVIVYAVLDRAD